MNWTTIILTAAGGAGAIWLLGHRAPIGGPARALPQNGLPKPIMDPGLPPMGVVTGGSNILSGPSAIGGVIRSTGTVHDQRGVAVGASRSVPVAGAITSNSTALVNPWSGLSEISGGTMKVPSGFDPRAAGGQPNLRPLIDKNTGVLTGWITA